MENRQWCAWKNWCWSGWEKWERKDWPVLALLMSPSTALPPCDAAGQLMWKTGVTGSGRKDPCIFFLVPGQQETSCITLKCYLRHISDQKEEHQRSWFLPDDSYMVLAFPPGASGPLLLPILSSLKKVAASIFKSISHSFFLKPSLVLSHLFLLQPAGKQVSGLPSSVQCNGHWCPPLMDMCSRSPCRPFLCSPRVQDWTELSTLTSKTSSEGL